MLKASLLAGMLVGKTAEGMVALKAFLKAGMLGGKMVMTEKVAYGVWHPCDYQKAQKVLGRMSRRWIEPAQSWGIFDWRSTDELVR